MKRTGSLVFLVTLLIIFVAVVINQTRAESCNDVVGTCENCDERCKAKHGPSCISRCDGQFGVFLCTCTYECVPPSPPSPPKVCNGGTSTMCSQNCPEKCCDTNCAQKYSGGRGFCNSLGNFNLCQCQYPC
ncbi:PREDICTED: putative defensin-like protein 180 [Camelina sativa]|uniref:Defensin-like protein n=1 Tax=Camelina sativa TaxID=90675 RepID=A0ABM0U4L4_CAMSA|nr:PREDICTED: putative defensin-like protein 180 [Camelina sativa]